MMDAQNKATTYLPQSDIEVKGRFLHHQDATTYPGQLSGDCVVFYAETIFQSRRWIHPVHHPGFNIILVIESSVLRRLSDLCSELR